MYKPHRKPRPKSKTGDISKHSPSPLHHTFLLRRARFTAQPLSALTSRVYYTPVPGDECIALLCSVSRVASASFSFLIFNDVLASSTLTPPVNIFTWKQGETMLSRGNENFRAPGEHGFSFFQVKIFTGSVSVLLTSTFLKILKKIKKKIIAGFRWFQVVSGGFRWFLVLVITGSLC